MNRINTIDILKDLIRIPSYVDGKKNEAEIAKYIKNFFKIIKKKYFIEEQIVEKNRINLIVKDCLSPKIILFGHMDTVLPKEKTTKPFEPKIINNKLFGLGSGDMKAGLAIMLSLAFKNAKKSLGLIFTADEEYEFKGSLSLVAKINFKPKLVINLEPTNLEIVNSCRGITEFSFNVYGKSAHASQKQLGINAIEKAVELTDKLQKSISSLDNKKIGSNSLNLAYLRGGVLQKNHGNTNKKISGLGMNVPDYAEVNCEIRIASHKITTAFISKQIKTLAKSLGIKITNLNYKFYFGSMLTDKEKLEEFETAIKNNGLAVKYRQPNLSGYYEVQMLQEKWNCDCLVFGPGPMELSHAANEYVDLKSLAAAEKVIESYINSVL